MDQFIQKMNRLLKAISSGVKMRWLYKNPANFTFFADFTHYCAKRGFHRSSSDTADKRAIITMTAAASKAARQIVLCLGACLYTV